MEFGAPDGIVVRDTYGAFGRFRATIIEAIEDLGLIRIPGGRMEFGAPDGIVVRDTYGAFGRFRGRGFSATIIATSIPVIGYELLENLRFRVNPVTQTLEPVPADEFGPPYIL